MSANFLDDTERQRPTETVRLDQASIDAIARHVVEILRAEALVSDGAPLTAAEVAVRYGVSRTWVYDNAERLGAIRLGHGKSPRLRFDPERVRQYFEKNGRGVPGLRKRQGPQRWLPETDLIPIRGH